MSSSRLPPAGPCPRRKPGIERHTRWNVSTWQQFAGRYPHTLSGGMKQRAAIARAMAMEPRVLLMDEPFAALDALTRTQMQEELLELWQETKFTVLFVTHSIPEAIRMGSRILLLSSHPGQVKEEMRKPGHGSARRRRQAAFRAHSRDGSLTGQLKKGRMSELAIAVRPLTLWERFSNNTFARKTVLLLVLALGWEVYARWLANPLVLPTFSETVKAMAQSTASGELPRAAWFTIRMLLEGYTAGLLLAGLLTAFASATRIGADLLEMLTCHVQSPTFHRPAASGADLVRTGRRQRHLCADPCRSLGGRAEHARGIPAVSPTLRMVGQNYGLSGMSYILRILIPGAFPSILTGLKVGWAFAWRTLIAAELVFGISSGSGGLGWYIFEYKNQLLIPNVFGGLLTVILLGLVVENLVFRTIENRTVRRWGMQS